MVDGWRCLRMLQYCRQHRIDTWVFSPCETPLLIVLHSSHSWLPPTWLAQTLCRWPAPTTVSCRKLASFPCTYTSESSVVVASRASRPFYKHFTLKSHRFLLCEVTGHVILNYEIIWIKIISYITSTSAEDYQIYTKFNYFNCPNSGQYEHLGDWL